MLVLAVGTGALPAGAEVSDKPAPDFSLPTLDGKSLGLEDFRGQYVVVNFWATWCGPCKMEMPSLEALHRRFKGRPLTVVGISNDMFGATVVAPYVKAQGLTFPILLDPNLEVSNAFGVLSLPTTVLVDPEGRIIGVLAGAENWSDPETVAYFESLLKP
jgi:peroxiredoxin